MITPLVRVNNGDALRLKGVNFDITSSANLDKAVTPGYTPTDIKGHEKRALISINPMPIELKVVLNSGNTNTSNPFGVNDMAILIELLRLPQTPYWKAIYYPTASNIRKRNSQIIYQLGETDTTEDQGDIDLTLCTTEAGANASGYDLTDVNYIPVKFEEVKIVQLPNNKIEVTISGVVTG